MTANGTGVDLRKSSNRVAEKSAREMKTSKQENSEEKVEVNILQNKGPTGMAVCFRCDSNNHSAGQCPFILAVCFDCRGKGHERKSCRQLMEHH